MKHKQPALYRMMKKNLEAQTMPHAFLLVGDANTYEVALWLSALIMEQSLDQEVLLQRIEMFESTSMVDFKLIDGSNATIKKEVIAQLQTSFQNTALEQTDQKVALMHHVHKATPEALNALLKFLEEPSGQTTTFILTTHNIELVLPTILSRCMVVHLKKERRQQFDFSDQHPMIQNHLNSKVSSSEQGQALLEEQNYQRAGNIALELLSNLQTNPEVACVNWQLDNQNDRAVLGYVIEIMLEHCNALLYNRNQSNPFTLNQLSVLISVFTNMSNHFNPSANVSLLIDEACYSILEVFHVRNL